MTVHSSTPVRAGFPEPQPILGHAPPTWFVFFSLFFSFSFLRMPAMVFVGHFSITCNLAEDLHVTTARMKRSDGSVTYTGVISSLSNPKQQTSSAGLAVSSLAVTWSVVITVMRKNTTCMGLWGCFFHWSIIDNDAIGPGPSITLASTSLRFFNFSNLRRLTHSSGSILSTAQSKDISAKVSQSGPLTRRSRSPRVPIPRREISSGADMLVPYACQK